MNKPELLILNLAHLVYNLKEERERTWWELGRDKKRKKKKEKKRERVIKQER